MIVTFHDIFQFSIHIFKTTFHPKLLESRVFSVKSRILLSFSQQSHGNRHLPTVPHGAARPATSPDDAEKAAPAAAAAAAKAAAPAAPEVETVQATEGAHYNGKMVIYNT